VDRLIEAKDGSEGLIGASFPESEGTRLPGSLTLQELSTTKGAISQYAPDPNFDPVSSRYYESGGSDQ
jgi:hypothetical protein